MHVVRTVLFIISMAIFGAGAVIASNHRDWYAATFWVSLCFLGLQAWRKYNGSFFGTVAPDEWEKRE